MDRPTEEAATIAVRLVYRERRFAVGEKIRLSQQDLAEICYFFLSVAIPTMIQSFGTFLKANEVPVHGEAKGAA
jgi:hypothetical protein